MLNEYLPALAGGFAIGAAATLLLLLNGRIAGISGIAWGAISGQADNAWRWLFLVGLVLGPVLYHFITGSAAPAPSAAPWWLVIAGGLLVGFGVRMGSGCTSGHGVCGLGRLSVRSLAATMTFMATGILTVFILRHVLGGGA